MPLLGLDPTETQIVAAYGREWTIGVIPAGKVRELDVLQTRALAPLDAVSIVNPDRSPGAPHRVARPGAEEAHARVAAEVEGAWLSVAAEWLRWGLRGLPSESARYAGELCPVLTQAALTPLLRVGNGILALVLANEIHKANTLSVEDVLGFK